MTTIKDFIQENIRIPSPPAIAVRILEAAKNDDTSFDELAKIISSDPALAAKILKVANSSFYAVRQKIESMPKALAILGTKILRNIALSFVIAKEMRGSPNGGFDFDFFWKRAVTAAVSANVLSSAIEKRNEDIFVTALLQDIGVVILYLCRPDDYLKVLDEKRASSLSIDAAERKIFGFDHQILGSEVLKHWGIPQTIYEPIQSHHSYSDIPQHVRPVSNLLLLADKMSSVYHGSRSAEKIQMIKRILCSEYKVDEDRVDAMIDAVADKSLEIFSFFEIDPGNMKPFSEILQEANEELGKLNLSYEQLIVELKQAKDEAEKLAQELKEANLKLRKMAIRDDLTGLYNHRYFNDLMDHEFNRAGRYKKAFSLLMVDIDHFKEINDKFGHQVGDTVLKLVGKTIKNSIRQSDVAVRYGGDEFAVVLPETGLKEAAVVAERLRKTVELLQVRPNASEISVTISVGATSYDNSCGSKEKADMVAAADEALYHSKKTGRNKISGIRMGTGPCSKACTASCT